MKIKVLKAKSLGDRAQGLLGREKIEPLLLETRFGIHTFGMKKAIDVVILDDSYYVQKLRKHLKPWRIFVWNPQFKQVLELPSGFIHEYGIKVGEKMELIEQPE